MEPLATNRRCFIWLCVCPPDESSMWWQKVAHSILTVIIFVALICGFSASLAFCLKFGSIDLVRSVFSFLFAFGQFCTIYMIGVALLLMRHKIDAIFKCLKTIYGTGKCLIEIDTERSSTFKFYVQTANLNFHRFASSQFKMKPR